MDCISFPTNISHRQNEVYDPIDEDIPHLPRRESHWEGESDRSGGLRNQSGEPLVTIHHPTQTQLICQKVIDSDIYLV